MKYGCLTWVLDYGDSPEYVVDIAGAWVSVSFMDERVRQYLCYNFKETQPGRLFLKSAYHWEYDGDSQSPAVNKIFAFEEDGRTVIVERILATGESREFEIAASVAENWDVYPAFGEYLPFCREERVAP
jgi:hypothetical protein